VRGEAWEKKRENIKKRKQEVVASISANDQTDDHPKGKKKDFDTGAGERGTGRFNGGKGARMWETIPFSSRGGDFITGGLLGGWWKKNARKKTQHGTMSVGWGIMHPRVLYTPGLDL